MAEEKTVKFSGHENQISSIVRLCREGGIFTDAELICDDGTILVHRIVLGAASNFLHNLLREPPSDGRISVLLPGVRRDVAEQLVQFIYSGNMQLSQYHSWELQQLVLLLQIDPKNVLLDVLDSSKAGKLDNSHTSSPPEISAVKLKPKIEPPEKTPDPHQTTVADESRPEAGRTDGAEGSPAVSPVTSPRSTTGLSPRSVGRSRAASGRATAGSTGKGTGDPTVSSTGEFMSVLLPSENSNVIKIVSSRKRRSSHEVTVRPAKEHRTDGARAEGGRGRGKGGVLRTRGRARSRGSATPRVKETNKGRHDMKNVETWVCAICGRYDPILPGGGGELGNTTEWIGCDCNRWFHKFCTRLKVVDDSFSCKMVHKTCLIHPQH